MPNPFFTVELLPAKHGDAIWVEYSSGTRTRRVVIDGGPLPAYKAFEASFDRLPAGDQRVELFVITHVDTDHIEGAIRLLALPRSKWPFEPQDIWFNGYRHVTDRAHLLGGREGEFLSALIHRRAFDEWNKAFGRRAVVIKDAAAPPRLRLADGMVLTLLSPTPSKLEKMATQWERDVDKWEIEPADLDEAWKQLAEKTQFHPGAELTLGPEDITAKLRAQLKGHDPSAANGSSIAFLAEFGGKSCLFLADAHMAPVCETIRAILPAGQRQLKVDAVKVSHHGSKHNITPELFEVVDAEHFLISTNGDKHQHPNDEAIQLIVQGATRRPTLWFNYRSPFTEKWEAEARKPGRRFDVRYPADGTEGITLPLV